MDDEAFKVYWWDPTGTYHLERHCANAEEAVLLAHSLTNRPAALLGVFRRIIITDSDDCTVFEWLHGKGVTFPTKEQLAEARVPRHDT